MIMEVYNSADDYTDWDISKQEGVESVIHSQTQTRSYSKY